MRKALLVASLVLAFFVVSGTVSANALPIKTPIVGVQDACACGNGGHGAVVFKMFTFGSYYPYIRLDCFYQDGWVYTTISLDPQCA